MTAVLSLQTVGKTFEPGVPVLRDVSLNIDAGAMVCLLGPSGCGKTTLLRLIAGFEEPDAGTIQLGGRQVSAPGRVLAPEIRQIGMVFQDYALFPHMTVAQNIVFGLFRPHGTPPGTPSCGPAATGWPGRHGRALPA